MSADDVRSAGNTFAATFLLVFGFVYFGIVEPHFSREHSSEQHLAATLENINRVLSQRKLQLDRIRSRRDLMVEDLSPTAIPATSFPTLNRNRSTAFSQASPSVMYGRRRPSSVAAVSEWEKQEEQELQISERIVQLGVAQQALEKAKLERKQYSIPLLSVSLDEEQLLMFFPILVLIALSRLLLYRSSLLKRLPPNVGGFLPPWAAPVPYRKTDLPFSAWVAVNLLGFAIVGSVLFFTLRFVFLYAREDFLKLHLVAADSAIVLLWALLYGVVTVGAMFVASEDSQVSVITDCE